MMHTGPDFVIAKVGLLALMALGVMCVLFYFQRTRPIGWMLLGVVVAAMLFGVTVVGTRPQWQPAPTARVSSPTPVDIQSLLAPRIELEGHAAVAQASAHPAQSAHPPETQADATPSHDHEADGAREPGEVSHVAAADAPQEDSQASARSEEANRQSPSWLDLDTRRGDGFRFVEKTDQFANLHQADKQADEQMVLKTAEVLGSLVGRQLIGDNYGSRGEWDYSLALNHLLNLGLTPGDVRSIVWKDDYVERKDLELETGPPIPMYRVYTLLEYPPQFRADLQERWKKYEARGRLGVVGVIAASVLGLLGLVWGVLKFDTVTKGYYTKRLIIAGVLVTIAVIGFFIVATA